MIARYIQKGEAIDYRPNAAVAAGDVIVQGNLVGIARLDIEAGSLGALAVVGVFEIAKATGAVAVGDVLYWDATNNNVTTTATGNTYIGKAVTASASADTQVSVLLNAPYVAPVAQANVGQ